MSVGLLLIVPNACSHVYRTHVLVIFIIEEGFVVKCNARFNSLINRSLGFNSIAFDFKLRFQSGVKFVNSRRL